MIVDRIASRHDHPLAIRDQRRKQLSHGSNSNLSAGTGTKTNPAAIVGSLHRDELSVCILCSPPTKYAFLRNKRRTKRRSVNPYQIAKWDKGPRQTWSKVKESLVKA